MQDAKKGLVMSDFKAIERERERERDESYE
jgi:hypothetical protein